MFHTLYLFSHLAQQTISLQFADSAWFYCQWSPFPHCLLFTHLTSSCTLIIPPVPFCQKYVQDVLREQLSETVYQCLREEGGHIYVCGDVTMAGDVLKTVQQIIKQQGNMSLEDAGFFISKLRVREEQAEQFTVQHCHHYVPLNSTWSDGSVTSLSPRWAVKMVVPLRDTVNP